MFWDHTFTVIGKNFLWVELHINYTAQNTLKSRSYKSTFRGSQIFSFRENARNTPCLNGTELTSSQLRQLTCSYTWLLIALFLLILLTCVRCTPRFTSSITSCQCFTWGAERAWNHHHTTKYSQASPSTRRLYKGKSARPGNSRDITTVRRRFNSLTVWVSMECSVLSILSSSSSWRDQRVASMKSVMRFWHTIISVGYAYLRERLCKTVDVAEYCTDLEYSNLNGLLHHDLAH